MAEDNSFSDANQQLQDWLDSRELNARRAIKGPSSYQNNSQYAILPEEFQSRLLDYNYLPNSGGSKLLKLTQAYDQNFGKQTNEFSINPYSQVDLHARRVSEQDPNFWIGRRLFFEDVKQNPEKYADYDLNSSLVDKLVDNTKKVEENFQGMIKRQRALQHLRENNPELHHLGTQLEGGASKLASAEIARLDLASTIKRLESQKVSESTLGPLIKKLEEMHNPEFMDIEAQIHKELRGGLRLWNSEVRGAGLSQSEFIPNPKAQRALTIGKSGGFLLGAAPQLSGLTGFIERIVNGGKWMGNPETGEFDVLNKSEIEDKKQIQRALYGPQPGDIL